VIRVIPYAGFSESLFGIDSDNVIKNVQSHFFILVSAMTMVSSIGNIFKQVFDFGTEKKDAVFTHKLDKSPFGQIGNFGGQRKYSVIEPVSFFRVKQATEAINILRKLYQKACKSILKKFVLFLFPKNSSRFRPYLHIHL
jgi:hypothetical protein